jgi:hypothetical protein
VPEAAVATRMTTPSATSMSLSENPGVSGASPIPLTTFIMAFHPSRILRRPPVRQSPCKPGGIARPL